MPVKSNFPLTMEEIGQNYGYILYRTNIKENETVKEVRLEGANDRVQCYHNNEFLHTFCRKSVGKVEISGRNAGGRIDLLCENLSRENFGTGLENQRKGISCGVKINDHRQFGYEIYPLSLDKNR